MSHARRFLRFNSVSAAGFALQLATVALLIHGLNVHYATATAIGVAAAVGHNFAWHRHWTWGDRRRAGGGLASFARFAGSNGAVSLAGNVAITALAVEGAGLTGVAANVVAVVSLGLLNFWLGDRFAFKQ